MESRLYLKFGFYSAVFASIFSLAYIIGQFAEWFGLLGSDGGPESSSTVLGLIILFTPSLFLGLSFPMLILSIHYWAPAHKKIWSHAGIIFATMYAVLICVNYYVQLTLVLPHLQKNEIESIRLLLFKPFDSFLYSVDILGYSFMSLSTLLTAFVFEKMGIEKKIRIFMIANGLIFPFIALQTYYHPLIWFASAWAITFPLSTILLALFFKLQIDDAIVK